MRIIHTSDWHLGQHFISKSRAAEHQAFIDWLLQQVHEQAVDAVIIAGDIFDTGTPPSYARKLYNYFVVEMSKLNCQLVVLGGNHDSVSTLDESKGLLAYLNTHVIANVQDDLNQQILVLNDKNGEAGAVLCAVPFIRPRDVIRSQAGECATGKQQAVGQAIADHYQALYTLAKQKCAEYDRPLPIIATGHLTAMGVQTSESVRDIYIGTLEAFPAKAFPAADYIALGHIHRPQLVAKSAHIRYCGSPIPLSFDELGSKKQVLVVDFADGKLSQVSPLFVPRFQPMAVIKGDLDSIRQQLAAPTVTESPQGIPNTLVTTQDDTKLLPTWLCIEVETQDYLSDLQQRIQDMTADLNVEVLQLRRARTSQRVHHEQQEKETLAELSVEDVFERRLSLEQFEGEQEQQRQERLTDHFRKVVDEVKAGDSA
ncbi:MAG: exonuclease subunit SbcD [Proteobacteria bacterium]|nr:MAG: exonuclease subunit SbcD [Pseudomonadota bacterium]